MGRTLTLLISLLLFSAAPAQAQWKPDTPVVLKGKIVSMHKRVAKGQIVIRNGMIEAILTPTAAPPAGAIVIDTKGYIYPGLINLHNHMRYNFVRLYNVPKHTDNHDEWPTGKAYAAGVNNPAVVTTSKNFYGRFDEALKFAEVRSIVGGETSVQGAENNPAISKSLVRNVELKNFGEDNVGQRAFTIDRLFHKHLDEVRPSIKKQIAWIMHLCEGIDEYSRKEWSDTSYDPNKKFSSSKSARNRPGVVEADLVWPGLVGVHCTAMKEEDFRQWRDIANSVPKIVWSPTSNLMLYGKTTDLRAALRQKALITLGTDWSPTGTKNLLWELKVADKWNRKSSPRIFRGYRKLLELVTTTPAKILGWEDKVGKIKVGMYADLLVVDDTKKTRSGYKNLIMATEENVQLVFVGGNPLYGDEAWMKQLKVYGGKKQYERIPETPDSRPKAIDMLQAPDQRNGTLSLKEVRDRLQEALSLDPKALADIVNAGVKETSTRTTYKAREYIRSGYIKLLKKKKRPVPAALEKKDSDLKPEWIEDFLELKYPHLKKGTELESLYTDQRFVDDLLNNPHWKDPYNVGIDLSSYVPNKWLGNAGSGLTGAIPD